jgi:hypothetical protein
MNPIFLSYARLDNEKDEHDANPGWISYFHARLRLTLSQKLGKRLDFWRDVQEIDKGETWHEKIKAELKSTKLLLCVLSPSFFASDNTRFELQHFLDCHEDNDPNALKESVIKVVKHQIETLALPVALREPGAFEFFINDPEKGELSYYTPAAGLRMDRQQEFVDELEELANRLTILLKEIGEVEAKPPTATVFLAVPYPGSALGELYQRIKTELQRRNIKVVPDRKQFFADLDEPDPIVLDQAVTNARLAVHLLNPAAGKEAMALDARQLEATTRRAHDVTRLRRLLWLAPLLPGASENELVASLRRLEVNGGRMVEGDRLVEEPFERFAELLLRILFPTEERQSPPAPTEQTSVVYLDAAPDETNAALSLAVPALKQHGYRCRSPLPVTVSSGDRVAIFWGTKDAGWVFGEIDRLAGCEAILIIKAPPATEEKARFLAEEATQIIDLTALTESAASA